MIYYSLAAFPLAAFLTTATARTHQQQQQQQHLKLQQEENKLQQATAIAKGEATAGASSKRQRTKQPFREQQAMGNLPLFSQNNRDDEMKQLRNQLKMKDEIIGMKDRMMNGSYWSCLNTIWDKKEEGFDGYFVKYKDVRKDDTSEHYSDLRYMLEKNDGFEIDFKFKLKEGSKYDAEIDSQSFSTRATDSEVGIEREDSGGTKNHTKKHLKTIRGAKISKSNKSKAHLLPNERVCNEYWLPELQMILGRTVDIASAPEIVMEGAARLHTNKLVFGMDHNHYFDDLEYGKILAIPLHESFKDVGNWRYQQSYEMLIVCDSPDTYKEVGIFGNEKHVAKATGKDLQCATTLLSEATKFLADSLVDNWNYYETVGNEAVESKKRKKMMQRIKEKIYKEGGGKKKKCKVFVPTPKLGESEDPRLYKVKFGDLFPDEEGRKYIPDPLLLLLKAAVNLSAHHYSTSCKLLPTCMSVSSEESEAPLITLKSPEGSSNVMAAISEIRVVSDDEDDNVSACSAITL